MLATMRVRCVVRGMVALAGAVLLFVALAFAHPLGASAATVTVNTTGDTNNTCATDGTTAPCSLRDAVTYANGHDSTTIGLACREEPRSRRRAAL